MAEDYPWYKVTEERTILQGDFLQKCPIMEPKEKFLSGAAAPGAPSYVNVEYETYDVVVMSQSCDIAAKKIDLVLVCPYFSIGDMTDENPELRQDKFKEKMRRGEVFGYHMLNKCEHEGLGHDYLIVDFRKVFSVPLRFLKSFILRSPKRLRLLPPYREHLSQAFARFFMRVGLPTEIPRFG